MSDLQPQSNSSSDVLTQSKMCTACLQKKPLSAFGAQKGTKDGRTYWCIACKRARARSRYAVANDPDHISYDMMRATYQVNAHPPKGTKRCANHTCARVFPLTATYWPKSNLTADGFKGVCKRCRNFYATRRKEDLRIRTEDEYTAEMIRDDDDPRIREIKTEGIYKDAQGRAWINDPDRPDKEVVVPVLQQEVWERAGMF